MTGSICSLIKNAEFSGKRLCTIDNYEFGAVKMGRTYLVVRDKSNLKGVKTSSLVEVMKEMNAFLDDEKNHKNSENYVEVRRVLDNKFSSSISHHSVLGSIVDFIKQLTGRYLQDEKVYEELTSKIGKLESDVVVHNPNWNRTKPPLNPDADKKHDFEKEIFDEPALVPQELEETPPVEIFVQPHPYSERELYSAFLAMLCQRR